MREEPPVGTTVTDSLQGAVGRVMGHVGGRVQLRPLEGGREWDAETMNLEYVPLSKALSPAVSEANSRSTWGDLK